MNAFIFVDVGFENWGITLKVHPQIFLSFSWVIFNHVMSQHQSHKCKNSRLNFPVSCHVKFLDQSYTSKKIVLAMIPSKSYLSFSNCLLQTILDHFSIRSKTEKQDMEQVFNCKKLDSFLADVIFQRRISNVWLFSCI